MSSSARRDKPPHPPGQRVATAQPLAALPLTDAACPLRASGTRGRRNQWNTGDGNTGSAAARDSKREAGQIRSCAPMSSASAPRESIAKSARHPAAPVGLSPQTRRYHLSSTPVQQLCTCVQSCDQKRAFLLDRARPVFFSGKTEKGPPPRPARWGEEERPSPRSGRGSALGVQGSRRSFRRRRKRSLADFATTTMGGASRMDNAPCGSRYPRGRRPAAHPIKKIPA